MNDGYYASAAVCARGHVETEILEGNPAGKRCVDCGAPVLRACGECGTRIRGALIVPNVFGVADYEPPKFCDDCGAAFPWVGRRERLYELANLAQQEAGIDDATRLWLQERLVDLQRIDAMDTKAQVQAWRELKDHVGVLWETPPRPRSSAAC